jgi:hypothetical protein
MRTQSQYESHEIGSGRPVLFQVPKSFKYENERAQHSVVRLEEVISITGRQPDRLRSTYLGSNPSYFVRSAPARP